MPVKTYLCRCRRFLGKVSPAPLPAGIHARNPLADIHPFSIKTQELKEDVDTPSKEGLIVASQKGIASSLLEWKGIEATEKLAESQNTKVVIIGNPKNGLSLILEGQK